MADLIYRESVLPILAGLARTQGEYDASYDKLMQIPPANRWIPCSERLPEQSEEGQPPNVKCSDCVLVASGDWIGMAYYVTYGEESQWEFADAQNKQKIDWTEVTHWMPMPEPPEGGAKDG